MLYHYRVNARIYAPGRDIVIRAAGTGWRRTHILASGIHLHVAALLEIENRGVRVPAGESRIFELHIYPKGDEELTTGSEWFTDYSGGAIGRSEIVEVLGRWQNCLEAPSNADTNSDFFVI
jgi:hypothetical protein